MDARWGRVGVLVWWVTVVAAGLAWPVAANADRLPDPVATHWGPSGRADASMSQTWAALAPTLIWLALAALFGAPTWRNGRSRFAAGWLGAMLGFIGVLLAGLQLVTVDANLDVDRWQDARLSGALVTLAIIVALLGGGAGWFVGRALAGADTPVAPHATPAPVDLASAERAVWVSHASNGGMLALGIVGLGGGVLSAALSRLLPPVGETGWLWLLISGACVLIGVAVLAFAVIGVGVDERGLRIAYGPWAWPATRIPLSESARPGRRTSPRCRSVAGAIASFLGVRPRTAP